MPTRNYVEPPNLWTEDCYRSIQSMIGRGLRNELEVPQEMPHRLLAIMLQLNEDEADE